MVNLEAKSAINHIVRDVEGLIEQQAKRGSSFFSISAWLSYMPINIYARAQVRMCAMEPTKVITIANIEIEESSRGHGIFRELLENLTALARLRGYGAVVVESVNNPRLLKHLLNNGFKNIYSSEDPTVFKKVNHEGL